MALKTSLLSNSSVGNLISGPISGLVIGATCCLESAQWVGLMCWIGQKNLSKTKPNVCSISPRGRKTQALLQRAIVWLGWAKIVERSWTGCAERTGGAGGAEGIGWLNDECFMVGWWMSDGVNAEWTGCWMAGWAGWAGWVEWTEWNELNGLRELGSRSEAPNMGRGLWALNVRCVKRKKDLAWRSPACPRASMKHESVSN